MSSSATSSRNIPVDIGIHIFSNDDGDTPVNRSAGPVRAVAMGCRPAYADGGACPAPGAPPTLPFGRTFLSPATDSLLCRVRTRRTGPSPALRSIRPIVRIERASYGASFSHPAHADASNSWHLSVACHVQLVGVRQSGTERVPLLLSTSSGAGYLSVLGTCCCSVLRLSRVYGEGSHCTCSSTRSAACMLPLSGAR